MAPEHCNTEYVDLPASTAIAAVTDAFLAHAYTRPVQQHDKEVIACTADGLQHGCWTSCTAVLHTKPHDAQEESDNEVTWQTAAALLRWSSAGNADCDCQHWLRNT